MGLRLIGGKGSFLIVSGLIRAPSHQGCTAPGGCIGLVAGLLPFEVSREALISALIVLVMASLPSVAWFFIMRRKMLRRQVYVIRSIEEAVKPRDQRYWVVGYLVGFTAKYWVKRGHVDKVYVSYTMPPYHAFFYLPVIAILRRRERLEVAVEYSRPLGVRGEAHIFDARFRSVRKSVEADVQQSPYRGRMEGGRLLVAGRAYEYIGVGEGLQAAKRLIEELARRAPEVYRVSVIPSRRMIIAVVTPPPSGVGELLEFLISWGGVKVESRR